MANEQAKHVQGHCTVRSLSPAYWYLYDPAEAKDGRGNPCRGQASPPFATRAELERWIERRAAIAKATGA